MHGFLIWEELRVLGIKCTVLKGPLNQNFVQRAFLRSKKNDSSTVLKRPLKIRES